MHNDFSKYITSLHLSMRKNATNMQRTQEPVTFSKRRRTGAKTPGPLYILRSKKPRCLLAITAQAGGGDGGSVQARERGENIRRKSFLDSHAQENKQCVASSHAGDKGSL